MGIKTKGAAPAVLFTKTGKVSNAGGGLKFRLSPAMDETMGFPGSVGVYFDSGRRVLVVCRPEGPIPGLDRAVFVRESRVSRSDRGYPFVFVPKFVVDNMGLSGGDSVRMALVQIPAGSTRGGFWVELTKEV